MNRTKVYKTPQFAVLMIGVWIMAAGIVGVSLQRSDPNSNSDSETAGSTLKVERTRILRPGATIDQLQGTRSLQNQSSSQLQRPTQADNLQPNAKTDTFSNPQAVQ